MGGKGISIQFSSLYGRLSWVRLKKHAEELAKWSWRSGAGGAEPGPLISIEELRRLSPTA
jgi:hypothetical protein